MQGLKRFADPRPREAVALVIRPQAREQLPVAGGPRLSCAVGQLLREIQVSDEYGDPHRIQVPVERPLSVLIDEHDVGTLWTLGACPEWLVLGYLWSRKLVTDVTCLESLTVDWEAGAAAVRTRPRAETIDAGNPQPLPGMPLRFGTESTGVLTQVESVALPVVPVARVSRTTLLALIEHLPLDDAIYRAAGSVHGCALFRSADLWISVEDVSRRNAIDTIIGWMVLHGVPGDDKILFTTGRLTAEVVAKAAYCRIPIVISRKGITATCYDLAARFGMTLFGHAAKGRYICYAGSERFDADS